MLKTSHGLSIVCTPQPFSTRGLSPHNQIFKKGGGGRTGSQFLEDDCWEIGGNFFQGELQFLHKK